mmetsp:Transcript_7481/g.10962  ORF Transcript_7481/g.10962 Transcript_7481/m.10962 type:complete len:222 (+) Transcript_7481:801-1466(+)
MIITGMILEDLKTVCTGKETHLSEAYCDQELMVLLKAQGVKAISGALLLLKTAPCLILTAIIATKTARKRLLKTTNAAEGKRPSGAVSVGLNSLVMISSCMIPQVKYESCSPQKHIANLKACWKNSGFELQCCAIILSTKPVGAPSSPLLFPMGISEASVFETINGSICAGASVASVDSFASVFISCFSDMLGFPLRNDIARKLMNRHNMNSFNTDEKKAK